MRQVFLRHLSASGRVPVGLDLVLWPEDVVDTDGPVMDFHEGRELSALARRLRATLVVGTVETVSDTKFSNSVKVFAPSGRVVDTYEKVHRVPFGEYVPFRSFLRALRGAVAHDARRHRRTQTSCHSHAGRQGGRRDLLGGVLQRESAAGSTTVASS